MRVRQLTRLLQAIHACDHPAASSGLTPRLPPNFTAEYRLIVHETTPEALRRAGLPLDVR